MSASVSSSGPITIGATRTKLGPAGPVDAAWQALGSVYDPELCIDVVSLGLVYDIRQEDDGLLVEMTLTTPGCPASESLPEMARMAVEEQVEDAGPVEVRVVWDPPWSPEMMDEAASGSLGFRS